MQSIVSWQTYFNSDTRGGTSLGTLNNGMTIGTMITLPFVTFIVDRFGRRWSIVGGCGIIIVGAVIQGAANGFGMFVGGRILLGVGGVISLTAAPPLVTECAYPSQRPVVTALLMPSWPIGAVLAAVATWAPYYKPSLEASNWGWRIPSLLQMALPVFQMIIAFFGPESPRWLISQGRTEEALQFFTKYHANGDRTHPIVAYEMAEITATIEEEKLQKTGSWMTFFQSRSMLHRLALCFAVPAMQQLSGNALLAYYLNIILDNTGISAAVSKFEVNFGLNLWTVVCSLFASWLVGVYKRRTLFLTGYTTMIISYTIFTILSIVNAKKNFENGGLRIAVLFFMFLYGGLCYQICSPIAFTYTMEIAPFSLRSKAAMIYQLSGSVVGFFNNYVNPIAMTNITVYYYIVWCVWLCVQLAVVYVWFPETYGLDLEEVSKAFGDDLVSGRAAMEKAHMTVNDVVKVMDEEHVEHV